MQTDKEFLDEKDFDFSEDYFEEDIKNQPEEPYPEDIKKEKPAKKEKPKYVGKTNVVSVQKKRQEEKTAKKLISISEKNKKVLEILKNLKGYPSESDFICQAIIEKYERDIESKSVDLKDAVKKVLEEMMGENFIIMKSSSDLNIVNTQPTVTPIEPQKEETNKEDTADLIRGIMDMWDDD